MKDLRDTVLNFLIAGYILRGFRANRFAEILVKIGSSGSFFSISRDLTTLSAKIVPSLLDDEIVGLRYQLD